MVRGRGEGDEGEEGMVVNGEEGRVVRGRGEGDEGVEERVMRERRGGW